MQNDDLRPSEMWQTLFTQMNQKSSEKNVERMEKKSIEIDSMR